MGIGAIGIGGMSAARAGSENAVAAIRTLATDNFCTWHPLTPGTGILAW
jgi:hypothetical protein